MNKITFVLVFLAFFVITGSTIIHASSFIIDSQGKLIQYRGQVLSENADRDPDEDNDDNSSNNSNSQKDNDDNDNDSSEDTDNKDQRNSNESTIRVESNNNRVRVRMSPESDDEDELEDEIEIEDEDDEDASDSADEIEVEEHENKFKIKIKSRLGELEIERRGIGALIHFPLSIGPNNELIVTTPAGSKVVAILPDQAVAKLLESNIFDRVLTYRASLVSPTPVATGSGSPSATNSAESEDEASDTADLTSPAPSESSTDEQEAVELVEVDGVLRYRIKGEKGFKLFGVVPFTAQISAEISAENGELLAKSEPWYLRIFPFLFTS